MKNKKVKIIGLSINHQLGILQACKMQFDDDNRIIAVKGAVGEGKSTLQKSIKLGTQGSKALLDNALYGDIDLEVQLLDGDVKLNVGCKGKEGKLIYTIYTKDDKDKIIKEPVIDGVKATPSKYLETLQTALTWKMDELTSENVTVQQKLLLKLYQFEFQKLGIIFDKNMPGYKDGILFKINEAEEKRNYLDMLRKQKGGIADDLKKQGYDTERPNTLPTKINTSEIEQKIQKLSNDIAIKKASAENDKKMFLSEIMMQGQGLINKAIAYNSKLEKNYFLEVETQKKEENSNKKIDDFIEYCNQLINENLFDGLTEIIDKALKAKKVIKDPANPLYIPIVDNKLQKIDNIEIYDKEGFDIINEIIKLQKQYFEEYQKDVKAQDFSTIETQIEKEKDKLQQAIELNKVCEAVDAFYNWQNANNEVYKLKKDYLKLLLQIDTGIEGLYIALDEATQNISLMYDGSYDLKYFNNPNKELRKVSSYSGTQKPVICLLIQNYLLNQKPKAMRYLFIDNIPIDMKTRFLLEKMAIELDLTIFLNITGDFTKASLQSGEMLIEGGEIFFND